MMSFRENDSLERLREVERERDLLAKQNAELLVLQQVFSLINSDMHIDDILSVVIRGIREALPFEHVAIFRIRDGAIEPHLRSGGAGGVDDVSASAEALNTPAVERLASGTEDFFVGTAGDGQAPVGDPSGTYYLIPLTARDTVRGLLYADAAGGEIEEFHVQALFDFAAQASMVIENARLHAEQTRLLEELSAQARSDVLTGLLNRRGLVEAFAREIGSASRHGTSIALLLFDLDFLKTINDTQGHAAGDAALCTFSQILESSSRLGDSVARLGGDEFVVALTHADHKSARSVLERIYERLATAGLSASAGIAIYPYDGVTYETLSANADAALYGAKRSGKGRYEFSSLVD